MINMISRWYVSRPPGCSLHLIFPPAFQIHTQIFSCETTEEAFGLYTSAAMSDSSIYARPCAVCSLDLEQLQCCGMFDPTTHDHLCFVRAAPWPLVTPAELQTALERPGRKVTWLWNWSVQSEGSKVKVHTRCLSFTACPPFFLWGR